MIGLHSPFVCCLIKFTKSLEKSSAGILAKICVCLMQNSKSEDISSAFSLFSPFLHQKFCHDAQWYKKDKPFRTFSGTFTQGRKYGILFMSLDVESLSVNPVCGKKIFLIRLLRFYRGSLCCLARFSRARWNMASFCCFLQLLSSTRPHGSKYGYLLRRKGNG